MPEPVLSAATPWRLATHTLVCPRCRGEVTNSDGAWNCGRCGRVGGTTLGFIDFLADVPTLEMAGGARMDLRADEKLARELHAVFRETDFSGLCRLERELYARQEGRSGWSPRRRSTVERFERRIGRVNAEGSARGADALLAKVDCKLEELGWPAVASGAALEAGGGQGLYVSALAARFGQVVFVDASLVNLLLAAKVVEEQGLQNVVCMRADVMAVPFAAETFDFVHQNGVVEHVSDPVAMVREGIRVRRETGYYVCVSPNRMSLAPEPHCGVPAYGFVPGPVRRLLIRTVRGLSYEESATDPRSLGQLKGYIRAGGDREELVTFFLPRHLPFTARQTPVRRLVRQALATPGLGAVLDRVLNVVLLPVVPQHIVITRPRPTG